MDKAARALQIAGCVAHTGDAFAFDPGAGGAVIAWTANPSDEPVPSQDPLNPVELPSMIRLVGPRAAFAAPGREPREGEDLTDADGNHYRVVRKPGALTSPLLTLVCVTSPA